VPDPARFAGETADADPLGFALAAPGADEEGALGPEVAELDVLPRCGQGREDADRTRFVAQAEALLHKEALGGGFWRMMGRLRFTTHAKSWY
jgi:hypothetical protein